MLAVVVFLEVIVVVSSMLIALESAIVKGKTGV